MNTFGIESHHYFFSDKENLLAEITEIDDCQFKTKWSDNWIVIYKFDDTIPDSESYEYKTQSNCFGFTGFGRISRLLKNYIHIKSEQELLVAKLKYAEKY